MVAKKLSSSTLHSLCFNRFILNYSSLAIYGSSFSSFENSVQILSRILCPEVTVNDNFPENHCPINKTKRSVIMDDIFHWCKDGNAMLVRVWLDDIANDMNQGDDHGFSPLHWASFSGHVPIVELLIAKGARLNATNMGDDTAMHLAAAHGHRDVVNLLIKNRADINLLNEHGNTPLHYACFWGYKDTAEDLINSGAICNISNKYGEIPFDKCKGIIRDDLEQLAIKQGQDLSKKYPYKDQAWYGTTKRSRDATLSRFAGLKLEELLLQQKIANTPSGETWRGIWQRNKTEICAKFLAVSGEMSPRIPRDFAEEYPRLRIFSHPNVLPVIGCVNSPPNLVVVNQLMPYGSLYKVLHEGSPIVVDSHRALQFAIDIARGMSFLHTLSPLIPRFYLSSKHVMIDEDLTARVNMADAKFSFQEKNKFYNPGWMSPEQLQKKHTEINVAKSDMWSFAILLWELTTRQVPFAEYPPMEIGMKIALEALRVSIPPGISPQMARLIKICMNEDPGKRPSFDQIIPILEKMRSS